MNKSVLDFAQELQILNPNIDVRVEQAAFLYENSDNCIYLDLNKLDLSKLRIPEGFVGNNVSIKTYDISMDEAGFTVDMSDALSVGQENYSAKLIEEYKRKGLFKEPKPKEEEKPVEEKKSKVGSKVINFGKKLKAKAVGLKDRVVDAFSGPKKIRKVDSNAFGEPPKEEKTPSQENIASVSFDRLKVSLPKINGDEYIISKLASNLGCSIDDAFEKDPEGLANMIDDFVRLKSYHDFAVKDSTYSNEKFDPIAISIFDLMDKDADLEKRLYSEVIINLDMKEGQLEFLESKLKELKTGITEKQNINGGATVNSKRKRSSYGGFYSSSNSSFTGTKESKGNEDSPVSLDSLISNGTSTTESNEEENTKDIPNPTLEREKARLKEIDKKYEEEKSELYNELDEFEKAFIDDAKAEGLEPGDSEFEQMLYERTVDKTKILLYFSSVEDLKILREFAKLTDIEKMFVEDAHAEGLEGSREKSDPEFDQMTAERAINKDRIFE